MKGYEAADFQPFDPVHERTEASVTGPNGKQFKVTKGAPQVILEHKFHIADVLQQRGHIVGMTGDGVNDAPPRHSRNPMPRPHPL